MVNPENDRDLGLATLLEVRDELGLKLSDELIHKLHSIQKKFQFEQDRTLSLQSTEHLIDKTLDESKEEVSKNDET